MNGNSELQSVHTEQMGELRRLRAIVSSMTDGLIVFDMDGNVLDMNPAALRLHGFDSVRQARRHLTDFPDTFALCTREGAELPVDQWPLARVLRGEDFSGLEVRVRRVDTGDEWVGSYSGTPIPGEDGQVAQGILTLRDVTEQVRAEDALRESTRRWQILSDTAARLQMSDDPQRLVQSLCERVMEVLDCQAFFNYLVDDAGGHLHLNAYAGIPESVALTIQQLDFGVAVCGCVARDGERLVCEDIPHTPDPRTDLVRSYGIRAYACHPLRSQGGRTIGTLSFGTRTRDRFGPSDLDFMKTVADQVATAMDRIRLLNSEREIRARLQAALDSMTDAVFISDADGNFIDLNDAFATCHRFASKEECSRTFAEYPDILNVYFLDGTLAPVDMWAVPRALRGETRTNEEYILERKDTGERWYGSYSFAPIRNSEAAIVGSVVVGRDVTERRQAEEALRQRAEELKRVMDVVPIAIWVGHDPECRDITGNRKADEFYEAEEGENVSASTTPVRRFFEGGRELSPEELPMQYAAAHNTDVQGAEFEVEMPSGTRRTLWGYAAPLRHADGSVRGAVGAFVDVTADRELEAHKRAFYRRTIEAATDGKLLVVDKDEVDAVAGPAVESWRLTGRGQMSEPLQRARQFAVEAGMDKQRSYDFLGCVTEAAANAVKHAGGGKLSLHRHSGTLMAVVSDTGPGIGAMALPDVALTRGYSTTGTLGMGYKVMIHFADRVYLATGPEGTTVAMEMGPNPPETSRPF